MKQIPSFSTLLVAAALSLMPSLSAAQDACPTKPIRFVVPYPPGGGTDVIARIVHNKMERALGHTIIIENRGGAGGSIGSEVVAKAAPDGYTVLFTLSSHTINPAILKKLSFNTAKDFEPVGMVASLPQILVSNTEFAAKNVAQLIAMAKAKPGTLQFASVGNGSPEALGKVVTLELAKWKKLVNDAKIKAD